jgi:hypothetical protein
LRRTWLRVLHASVPGITYGAETVPDASPGTMEGLLALEVRGRHLLTIYGTTAN